MRKSVWALIRAAFVLLVLARPVAPGYVAAAEPVRVGYVHVFDDAPVLVARDGGFYERYGLNVDVQAFTSGPTLAKALVANRLDIGVMGFTNALTWAAQGAELYIVGKVQNGYHSLVTRADSGIKDLDDLKGKRIASQGAGSTADIVLKGVVLPAGGLKASDVQLLYTDPSTALQSLLAGRVDAAFLFEPFDRMFRYQTRAREIYEVGTKWPFPCMVIVVSGKFMRENPTGLSRFLQANQASIEFMNKRPEEAAALLAPQFIPEGYIESPNGRVPAVQIIREALATQVFDWRITSSDVSRMQELMEIMLVQGLLKERVDIGKIVAVTGEANRK
ncbi:MAG TPA: ABC transporter substrate-binding protein [Firmicutes bacterium]|nr:ABC transporter substrate-binding protein [Bacillota bacterium]